MFFNHAKIAQLVEHHLAKVEVAGSNPVFRSTSTPLSHQGWSFFLHSFAEASEYLGSSGGIGRHVGLKIQWPLWPCGFKSRLEYQNPLNHLILRVFLYPFHA